MNKFKSSLRFHARELSSYSNVINRIILLTFIQAMHQVRKKISAIIPKFKILESWRAREIIDTANNRTDTVRVLNPQLMQLICKHCPSLKPDNYQLLRESFTALILSRVSLLTVHYKSNKTRQLAIFIMHLSLYFNWKIFHTITTTYEVSKRIAWQQRSLKSLNHS